MIRLLLALTALFAAVPAMAQAADGIAIEGIKERVAAAYAIKSAMLDSAEGWNRGDIDRFLAVYSDDPATSFTTSKGVAWGKANIRARYMVTYARQFGGRASAAPTQLSFDFENFRMIGSDHALLIAQWKLVTNGDAGTAQTGMTSLLFHKEAGGWKIVADHSS